MTTESTEKLLEQGLQELYYTEQELDDALETLASETQDENASQAFREHREETQQHIERLEEVFDHIGAEPETRQERAVDAMIEEHQEFSQENDGEILDRYNIAAGQKTEHHEIAAYGNVTSLAGKLGHDQAADILEENLREEQDALDKLSRAGEQFDEEEVTQD